MFARFPRRIFLLGTLLTACTTHTRYPATVPERAPRRGAQNPKLVLQEIGDYECPFCGEVEPAVEKLMETYGSEIALVWRHYPLGGHPHAALAAESAVEVQAQAGDQGFWKYHATLFRNQGALESDDLVRYAGQVGGVDLTRFARALASRVHRNEVVADMQSIQALHIEGLATPTFLLDGDALVGAYPYDSLSRWVEDRL